MIKTLRAKIHASRMGKTSAVAVALMILLTGSMLLYQALRPIHPPDLKTASLVEVIDFLCSDYDRLTPARQRLFLSGLSDWYFRADAQMRAKLEASWIKMKMPHDIKSRITAQIRVATVHKLASNYATLDAGAKKKYLAQVSFMITAMPSGFTLEKLLSEKQWDQVIENPVKYRHKMDNYAQEMALHSTAEQRAQFIHLCHDLAVYNGIQKK